MIPNKAYELLIFTNADSVLEDAPCCQGDFRKQ